MILAVESLYIGWLAPVSMIAVGVAVLAVGSQSLKSVSLVAELAKETDG
jgi:hypothetical protein